MQKQKVGKILVRWQFGLASCAVVVAAAVLIINGQSQPLVQAQVKNIHEVGNPSMDAYKKAVSRLKAKAAATQQAAAKQVVGTTTKKAVAGSSPAPALGSGLSLYANPNSNVATNARAWAAAHPEDAGAMNRLAATPMAQWFGGWNNNIQAEANAYVGAANGRVPILVAYNIPQRDCGSYSAGGASGAEAYKTWINGLAAGIGPRQAIVIVEPDALASMDCLSPGDQALRQQLLTYAVQTLRNQTRAAIYIDAGHANWQSPAVIASRLQAAGVATASGFSLNVSNYISNGSNAAYGQQVSALLGGKHFIVDTSRNGGNVAGGEWCNPAGAALGASPSLATGNGIIDAYLWIKNPGESDGQCGLAGAPPAGQWWGEFAVMLAHAAGW